MTEFNKTVHKREIVKTVLQPYLAENELNDALNIWEQTPPLKTLSAEVNHFLLKIVRYRKVALSIRKIKGILLQALGEGTTISKAPQREFSRDLTANNANTPRSGTQANRQESSTQSSLPNTNNADAVSGSEDLTPIKILVFSTLLDGMVNEIRINAENSRLAIKDSINAVKLASTEKEDIESFIDGHSNKLNYSYSQTLMTEILNQLYVVACELLGPVKADECLSNAVQRAEKLDAARKVPPRSLL